MITSLRGTLLERQVREGPVDVVIECGGVGYRTIMTANGANALGHVGEEVFVYCHHHVREDAQTLYGFGSRDERDCFVALISAHGVGPSVGLAILGTLGPQALLTTVQTGDTDLLCTVPGIGKKTATKLLVELQSKFDVITLDGATTQIGVATEHDQRGEVRAALFALGYSPDEVRVAVQQLPTEGDVETLLRDALRGLATAI